MNQRRIIDLRSDTVTHPSPAMYKAIAAAELGDDVLGDDPTVKRLEEMAAERLGMEAALFVTSGTQGNLTAIMTHCQRGDEVICGDKSHVYNSEQGGIAGIGNVIPHVVPNQPDGRMELTDIEAAFRPDRYGRTRTRLVSLENTHNSCNGAPLTAEYTQQVVALAHRKGAKVHVDGARLFNAAVALGVEAKELVKGVDSVTFCLSKGLSCPIGSVLCGPKDYIYEAGRNRKVMGGAMRQVGIVAAPGIVALNEMIDRLAEDHANAKRLAEGLADIPGIVLDPERIKTNIVYFDVEVNGFTAMELQNRLAEEGVKIIAFDNRRVRVVTHYGITADDIETTLLRVQHIMAARRAAVA